MLAIQSGIAKYHCLYTQGAVAFQTPGVFSDSPGSVRLNMLLCHINLTKSFVRSRFLRKYACL